MLFCCDVVLCGKSDFVFLPSFVFRKLGYQFSVIPSIFNLAKTYAAPVDLPLPGPPNKFTTRVGILITSHFVELVIKFGSWVVWYVFISHC